MSSEEISRRRMLKRIGAGAAVAWSAPILTSIRTPAFAQYGACSPGSSCFACQGCPTPESPHCGGNPDCFTAEWCGCVTTAEGENACLANVFGSGPCSSSDTCLENEVCVAICAAGCDAAAMECIPTCASGASAPKGARRPASRA
jgi:hypothetical protein